MKKILFYASGVGVGGVEKVLLQVLKEIDKSKYDIKLGLNNANENYFENEIPSEINYKYMVPLEIIERTKRYREKKKNIIYKILYSYMLWYEKYIAKKNFLKFAEDREILIDFKSGDFLRLVNLFKNKKKIVWLHGELSNLVKFKKNEKKFKRNLFQCDKIVLISNEMKRLFEEKLSDLKEKTELIYNPFDFKNIKEKAENLSEKTIESKKLLNNKYFLMVARIDLKSKDFFTLLKAFKEFSNKNSEYKLFLLGDGNKIEKEKVLNKIEELELNNKVFLLGARKNPYPWIKNAKILIQSSNYEGLPTVLIEGLILEKLIISTDCPTGPKEILENGEVGELVKIGDYKSMKEKIEKILTINPEEKIILKNKIRDSKFRFEKNKIVKKIEELLEGI